MDPTGPGGGYFAPAAVPVAPPPPPGWAPPPPPPPGWAPPPPPPPGWAPPPPPGWAPPAQQWGSPPAFPTAAPEPSESGVPVREALVVTGIALVCSLFLTLTSRHQQIAEADHALRKGLVITLFFYLVLGSVLLTYVLVRKVRLVFVRGTWQQAVLFGLPLGVALGGLAVGINSAAQGHLAGDPNVELLVGGGGVLRIGLTLITTSVLAPLVEETLFRGICAGSMVHKNVGLGLWTSAVAFAVWHMNPSSLRYYALMGLALAFVWRRRGLLASMCTHAAFNGMLTIAAVLATSGAGHLTTYGPLSFELPGGWHAVHSPDVTGGAAFEGPAAASLFVTSATGSPTVSAMLLDLQDKETASDGFSIVAGSERSIDVDGQPGVEGNVLSERQPGHVIRFDDDAVVYTVVVITGGSPNGERDWDRLVASLRIG